MCTHFVKLFFRFAAFFLAYFYCFFFKHIDHSSASSNLLLNPLIAFFSCVKTAICSFLVFSLFVEDITVFIHCFPEFGIYLYGHYSKLLTR